MKKIIVAAFAVAVAAVAQAASFNWTSSGTNAAKTFYGANGSTIAGMTVYLVDAAVVSQADLVAAIRDGGSISSYTTVATSTLDANSRLTAKEFSYGTAGNDYDFYMAIIDSDNIFVTANNPVSAQASDTVPVSFSGIKTATQTVLGDGAYAGSGWYATGSTAPEPTSGLLLLLGMAGLALKRKVA